ncbi:MAG: hypothetical protein KH138_04675 [Firmicutes bacterium]|nr:hypothetical protein [Bacillota bacterium]
MIEDNVALFEVDEFCALITNSVITVARDDQLLSKLANKCASAICALCAVCAGLILGLL